jgi:hypothetical protein
MIDASYFWTKRGALTWTDLADLIDRPESLWMNGDATRHGVNDRINQALATQIANSVFLIEPGVVDVQVLTEVGVLDNPTRRVRAAFRYNGIRYNLVVTDPLAEEAFLAGDKDEYQLKNIFLSVSLTEVFGGDGCCHKLVEAIISAQPLRDVTQARHVDEFAQVRDER